jgi:hypothetical protein
MMLKYAADFLHAGEIEAQRRFHGGPTWEDAQMAGLIRDTLSPAWTGFLESQPFFFMATANQRGECDCSFRGREFDASGHPYPVLKVLDAKTLVFPDYSGNKLYNSLGNILVNPHVGLLFVDFQQRARARVNGSARIVEDRAAYSHIWPLALRYIFVEIRQAYPNCKARIPSMTMVPPSDAFFDE